MTKVKICGIRQLDHALAAAQAGADYIGLVFVPQHRRRIEADTARGIVSGLKASGSKASGSKAQKGNVPQVVGLFADQPMEEVNQVIEVCGLDLVQLCGAESLEYCRQIQAKVIKVLHVPLSANPVRPEPLRQAQDGLVEGRNNACGSTGSPPAADSDNDFIGIFERSIQTYTGAGYLVTLDRQVDGLQGGTGQNFDWDIAARLSRLGQEYFLAGGLTPGNVAKAVAQVHPWGVDVSSGVETDGVKDPEKIRAFIQNAKGAIQKADHERGKRGMS